MTTTETPTLDVDNLSHVDSDVPPVVTESENQGTPATTESSQKPAAPPFLRRARRGATSANTPPKPAPRPKPDKTPRVAKDDATLKKALVELYSSIGMVLLPFDAPCGTVVINSADQSAEALVKLAAENDGVRKALNALTQTSAWGGVIAAHLPIIMAVVSHHSPAGKNLAKAQQQNAPDNVTDINAPRHPETVRANTSADGFGRFCPQCNAALIRGVTHMCTGMGDN